MQNKERPGFISILNIAYFTHGTSYRTLETKEEIMKAIKKKFPKITSVIPTYKVELKNALRAINNARSRICSWSC